MVKLSRFVFLEQEISCHDSNSDDSGCGGSDGVGGRRGGAVGKVSDGGRHSGGLIVAFSFVIIIKAADLANVAIGCPG